MMTRDQYFGLVAACDDVLLEADAPKGVVAVPWLHVMREHPVFLARYEAVFRRASLWRDIRDVARQMVSARRPRWPLSPGSGPDTPREPIDILFVSHLLNPGALRADDDFYFASLPADVQAEGLRACVALIDHTPAGVRPGWSGRGRMVLARRLSAAGEREIARDLGSAATYLSRTGGRLPGLPGRVRRCASWFARGPEAQAALRIAKQVEVLVRRLAARMVVMTHEGHAWERLVCASARRASPSVLTVGYHPTALFALQHALTRRLQPEFNPDLILTAGRVTRDGLAARPGLQGIPVEVLGSNRHVPPGSPDRPVLKPGCVVVPEGLPSECRILFAFAIAAARLAPGVRWLLRLHPVMSVDRVKRDLGDEQLPPNVVFSTRPLEEDFADSSWVLYRGSSAAIQAAGAGLRPIYVKAGEPFTIDPMSDLGAWRMEVDSPRGAVKVIASDQAAPSEALRGPRACGIRYASDYFQPVNADVLIRALEGRPPPEPHDSV